MGGDNFKTSITRAVVSSQQAKSSQSVNPPGAAQSSHLLLLSASETFLICGSSWLAPPSSGRPLRPRHTPGRRNRAEQPLSWRQDVPLHSSSPGLFIQWQGLLRRRSGALTPRVVLEEMKRDPGRERVENWCQLRMRLFRFLLGSSLSFSPRCVSG